MALQSAGLGGQKGIVLYVLRNFRGFRTLATSKVTCAKYAYQNGRGVILNTAQKREAEAAFE